MSGALRKYPFDTEFSPNGAIVRAEDPSARRFSMEDVEKERVKAFAAGKAEAQTAAEHASAVALQNIAKAALAIASDLTGHRAELFEEGKALALSVSRKIAGAALESYGEARALAVIAAAMDEMPNAPRLVLRVPEALAATIKPKLEELVEEHGHQGAVIVRADARANSGAVAVEWAEGAIRTDPAEIAARIEALIAALAHEAGAAGEQA